MTAPTSVNVNTLAFGNASLGALGLIPVVQTRAPNASDVVGPNGPYKIGQAWINSSANQAYVLTSLTASAGVVTANWEADAGSTTLVASLSDTTGTKTYPSAGNIQLNGTASEITSTAGTNEITFSIPSAFTAPGSITATTTVTATLGAITATNGNLVLGTAGNKIDIATGTNSTVGTSGAMTAGAVTVSNTSVTANSLIFCYPAVLGTVTVPQAYYISTITAGTSFVITSQAATDTSTWHYWIIN